MDVTAFSLRLVFKSILLQNKEGEECKEAKLLLVPKWCFCISTQEEEHFEIKEGIVNILPASITEQTFLKCKR